jgi:hypothetical protein
LAAVATEESGGQQQQCAFSPFVNLGMQNNGRRAEPWMKKVTTFCINVGG